MNGYCYLNSLKVVDASPKAAIQNNPDGLCGFIVERRVPTFNIEKPNGFVFLLLKFNCIIGRGAGLGSWKR